MQEALDLGLMPRKKVPVILQAEASECGLACLAMVMASFGRQQPLSSLRTNYPVSTHGMTVAALGDIADAEGMELHAFATEASELEQLQLPAVLHWNQNHFVVLTSLKPGLRAVINDPAIGTRSLNWSEVRRQYSGVALEIRPTPDFKPVTRKPATSVWSLMRAVPQYSTLGFKLLMLALMLELMALTSPLFLQAMVDEVLPVKDSRLLFTLSATFVVIALIRIGATLSRNWMSMALSGLLTASLKNSVFSQVLRLPVAWFEKRGAPLIATRFHSLDNIRDLVTNDMVMAALDLAMAVVLMLVMMSYAPGLAFVSMLVAALTFAITLALRAPYTRAVNEAIAADAQENNVLTEGLVGASTLKYFAKEGPRRRQYQAAVLRTTNRLLDLKRLTVLRNTGVSAVTLLEEIVVFSLGAYMVIAGQLSLGLLAAFLAYKQIFSIKLQGLVSSYFSLREFTLHAENVADVTLSQQEARGAGALRLAGPPAVEFDSVSYAYEGALGYALRNFSLTLAPGELVGLKGPSGSGKTTLVKLLLGALEPQSGSIKIDGIDLAKLSPSAYRPVISVVQQQETLFSGTLLENIVLFEDNPDMARVLAALSAADFVHDVDAMPLGLTTFIQGQAPALSGGQRQKLLLARALYKKAAVLILDEATNSLDLDSERNVALALRALGMTTLLVAHRPETLNRCDRVVHLGPEFEG